MNRQEIEQKFKEFQGKKWYKKVESFFEAPNTRELIIYAIGEYNRRYKFFTEATNKGEWKQMHELDRDFINDHRQLEQLQRHFNFEELPPIGHLAGMNRKSPITGSIRIEMAVDGKALTIVLNHLSYQYRFIQQLMDIAKSIRPQEQEIKEYTKSHRRKIVDEIRTDAVCELYALLFFYDWSGYFGMEEHMEKAFKATTQEKLILIGVLSCTDDKHIYSTTLITTYLKKGFWNYGKKLKKIKLKNPK